MRLSRQEYWGFPGGLVVKNPPTNAGNTDLDPGLGRFHVLWGNYIHSPGLVKPGHLEPTLRDKSTAPRGLCTARKSSPCWPQLEESLCIAVKGLCTTSNRPYAAKKKSDFLFFFEVLGTWFLLQKLLYILASSLPLQGGPSAPSKSSVSWPWSPQNVHQIRHNCQLLGGFPRGSSVKNLPEVQEPQEMWVWALSWEDPLEESRASHSSILAWRIPCTEEPGGV